MEEGAAPGRLKRFWKETKRVMHIIKKPNRQEFLTLVKITGLGCAIIGVMGFLIFLIRELAL